MPKLSAFITLNYALRDLTLAFPKLEISAHSYYPCIPVLWRAAMYLAVCEY